MKRWNTEIIKSLNENYFESGYNKHRNLMGFYALFIVCGLLVLPIIFIIMTIILVNFLFK